ncbi:hypothetical protein ENBRE01_0123 [Enteropsectra breve]|nr:hypothetical protein ENBRE01_0123 [Enteropsectra breve]
MDKDTALIKLRSCFVEEGVAKKLIKKHGLKFNVGFLNNKEQLAVREKTEEFLSSVNITMDDLEQYALVGGEFPFKELMLHIMPVVPFRTYKNVAMHVLYRYHPYSGNNFFTEKDDIKLLELVEKNGFRWHDMCTEITKYRDHLRKRYLVLKQLNTVYVGPREIEILLKRGLPTTEREWNELAKKLNTQAVTLKNKINKYLHTKRYVEEEHAYDDIVLLVHIMAYNYYCQANIDIPAFLAYIKEYGKEYYSKRKIIVDDNTEKDIEDQNIEYTENIENDGDITKLLEHNEFNLENKVSDDDLVDMDELTEKLDDFFKTKDLDLSVDVEIEDVFWHTIAPEINFSTSDCRNNFNNLKNTFYITKFQDVKNTLYSLAHSFIITEIRKQYVKNMK